MPTLSCTPPAKHPHPMRHPAPPPRRPHNPPPPPPSTHVPHLVATISLPPATRGRAWARPPPPRWVAPPVRVVGGARGASRGAPRQRELHPMIRCVSCKMIGQHRTNITPQPQWTYSVCRPGKRGPLVGGPVSLCGSLARPCAGPPPSHQAGSGALEDSFFNCCLNFHQRPPDPAARLNGGDHKPKH